MDQDFTLWVKGVSISLNFYNKKFDETTKEAVDIFEETFELLFLKDRVYTFLLVECLKGTKEEEDFGDILTFKKWKQVNEIAYGFGLRLEILEGKVKGRWREAYMIVRELFEGHTKLQRAISFSLGKC